MDPIVIFLSPLDPEVQQVHDVIAANGLTMAHFIDTKSALTFLAQHNVCAVITKLGPSINYWKLLIEGALEKIEEYFVVYLVKPHVKMMQYGTSVMKQEPTL